MSILSRLASSMRCSDDEPNIRLAQEIAAADDTAAVSELIEGLASKDKAIQSDCIKTLYENGTLKPDMIAEYANVFADLLHSRNNRLVWGAMIALSAAASCNALAVKARLAEVLAAMKTGSVITVDNGVRVLAALALADPDDTATFKHLLDALNTCRPSSLAQYAESAAIAVNLRNKAAFLAVLREREPDMTSTQATRIRKVYKALDRL